MAITNLKQYDPRWSSHPFAGETMGPAGCGPTSVADILGHKTPVTVADWMQSHGYASNGSGTYHSGIRAAFQAFGYNGQQITGSSIAGAMETQSMQVFRNHIQNGYCGVILFGGVKTGCIDDRWTRGGHYVACVGYSNGKYLINDPASESSARDGWRDWSEIAGRVKHLFTCTVRWGNGGGKIDEDGYWGPQTTTKAQQVFKTYVDGEVSNQGEGMKAALPNCQQSSWKFVNDSKIGKGSDLVRAIQKKIKVDTDGSFGPKTLLAFQKWLGVDADGSCGGLTVTAFQHWLNSQAGK